MDQYLIHEADLSGHFQWDQVSYIHCESSEKTGLKMGTESKEKNWKQPSYS